jgi:hypothetical protein
VIVETFNGFRLELFHCSFSIHVTTITSPHVLIDSHNCKNLNLIIWIVRSNQIWSVGFKCQIDKDCLAFTNDIISINKIRKIDSRIFLDQIGFIFITPIACSFWCVNNLIVWNLQILEEESNSFGKTSDIPVAESHFVLSHSEFESKFRKIL